MKFAPLLFLLPLTMTLAAQTRPANTNNKALQEAQELRDLRDAFSGVLDTVNASWFGEPYQKIRAVDIKGTLALVIKGSAIDTKIEQLTQGVVKSPGVKSGQAVCTLEGTYFANGDHLYNVRGDMGVMRFQRTGEKGFWYIEDQNAYTMAIDMAPPDAPLSFRGWFASMVSDIKDVYVKGSTFKVSKGKDVTIGGKNARTVVFDAPTAPYDPKKREQAAADTFGFWKKGRLEATYDSDTKQPLKMDYTNIAQGMEASMAFNYYPNGRIREVAISNRSKQWEGPGYITVTYNGQGMITNVSGELTGESHKIKFDLNTDWKESKPPESIRSAPRANATRLGREDMELRLAMMFAGNIGDLQRAGFNVMAPKVTPASSSRR